MPTFVCSVQYTLVEVKRGEDICSGKKFFIWHFTKNRFSNIIKLSIRFEKEMVNEVGVGRELEEYI
jgi:hypothetical protein